MEAMGGSKQGANTKDFVFSEGVLSCVKNRLKGGREAGRRLPEVDQVQHTFGEQSQ